MLRNGHFCTPILYYDVLQIWCVVLPCIDATMMWQFVSGDFNVSNGALSEAVPRRLRFRSDLELQRFRPYLERVDRRLELPVKGRRASRAATSYSRVESLR